MKQRLYFVTLSLALIGAIVLCYFALPGCASQPGGTATNQPANDATGALILANQSLTTVVDTLTGLRAAGAFGNQDWANIQTGIKAASAALDAWGQNPNSPGAALASYQAAILSLQQNLKLGAAKVPTTQKAS